MLITCLAVSITSFKMETAVLPEDDDEMYWSTGPLGGITFLWTIVVASIGIAIELILAPFRIMYGSFVITICGCFVRIMAEVVINVLSCDNFRILLGTLF